MMGDLVFLDVDTTLDVPADRVLDKAKENLDLDDIVVVLGYDREGGVYFASSTAAAPRINWLLDRAKHRLQKVTEPESE